MVDLITAPVPERKKAVDLVRGGSLFVLRHVLAFCHTFLQDYFLLGCDGDLKCSVSNSQTLQLPVSCGLNGAVHSPPALFDFCSYVVTMFS